MLGRNMVHDISRDPEKLVAFTYPVEPLGACTGYHLDLNSLSTAAYYILTNMQEVAPYILPQVLSGRAIDANMEPLQEDVSNTTPIEFSSRSLFVNFSIYEMEDEQEQQNEVESEEDDENEMEAGEDHEEEDDEEEEEEEDGYDSIEVDSVMCSLAITD
ncbi:hypothetical protein ACET3Z_028089 [Daucus carota]